MSTKTIRKRIALATVTALGAGVLSLVSTTVAHAGVNVAAGTTPTSAAAAGVLNIGTAAATNGQATTSTTYSANASLGLLSVSNLTSSTLNADNTQAATLLSNGTLVVYTTINKSGANSVGAISVTGGTVVSGTPATSNSGVSPAPAADVAGTTFAYNGGLTAVGFDVHSSPTSGSTGAIAFAVRPNAGVTSMTVSYYSGTYAATTGDAAAYATTPSTGTLSGNITVTIAATSSAGTISLANSAIYYATNSTNSGTVTADDTTPASGQSAIGTNAWNVNQYASAYIRDAYGSAITAGALIQASATNGAYVSIQSGGGANTTTPTAATAFVTGTASVKSYGLQVATNSTGKSGSTTVTVTVNGTVLGTKTFNWFGKVAKVTLSAAGNGKVSTSAGTTLTTPGQFATLVLKDDAGTVLYPGAHAVGTGSFPAVTSITKNAATSNVTLASTNYLPGDLGTAFASTGGVVGFNCTLPSNTSGSLVVDYTNIDGSIVTSNALPVSCSGAPYSYSAAWDKSTYKPGDVATLTVTFKDSKGALAADVFTQNADGTVATSAISTTLPTITASNMTAVGGTSSTNAAALKDVTTNGVKKYTFVVGTTTGSYSAVVSFPDVDVPTTANYTIADGSTSLNDVLKGIVALIASINKQIAALAKLVTKKK